MKLAQLPSRAVGIFPSGIFVSGNMRENAHLSRRAVSLGRLSSAGLLATETSACSPSAIVPASRPALANVAAPFAAMRSPSRPMPAAASRGSVPGSGGRDDFGDDQRSWRVVVDIHQKVRAIRRASVCKLGTQQVQNPESETSAHSRSRSP